MLLSNYPKTRYVTYILSLILGVAALIVFRYDVALSAQLGAAGALLAGATGTSNPPAFTPTDGKHSAQ